MGNKKIDYKFIKALKSEDLTTVLEILSSNSLSLTNWIGDLGITALHLAVGYGTESFAARVTHHLLQYGSNPNAPSSCGKTSVHVAAAWRRVQIIHMLLLHGGDPWIQDDERKNAFNYAFEFGAWEVIKVLHDFQLTLPQKCCRLNFTPVEKNDFLSADLERCAEEECSIKLELSSDLENSNSNEECSKKTYITTNHFIIQKTEEIDLENSDESKEISMPDGPEEENKLIIEEIKIEPEIRNRTYTLEAPSPSVEKNDLFSELISAVHKRALRLSGIETLNSQNETPIKNEEIKSEDVSIEILDVSENTSKFVSLSPDASGNYESCEEINLSSEKKIPDEFDEMRSKLRALGMSPGPITHSTKAIYQRQLERLMKQGFTSPPPKLQLDCQSPNDGTPGSNFSPELINAINNPLSTDYSDLEKIICDHFSKPDYKGSAKTCFNYLLLDSRKTQNLARRASSMSPQEIFSHFLAAIFYIGKGQAGRPYNHLQQARQAYNTNQEPDHPKEKAITDAWRSGHGIICLQVFHNINTDEALTREAAMIHALGRQHLHNQRKGDYRGCVSLWDPIRQRMLGVHLLIKAKELFLRDEERPLFPGDF